MSTPKLTVPPPLRGADPGSFAEHSIVHRLPHIAQRVVADNPLTSAMRHQIADLIAAIPHRTLEAFTDPTAPDMPGWRDYVCAYLDHNWLQVPWFFAETYFYRRLIAITDFFRTGFDSFATQKQQGLQTTVAQGRALATQAHRLRADGWRPESFIHFLTLALWGNQADMSLWAPDDPTQPSHTPADHPHEHLVVNEAEAVAQYLTALQDAPRAEALCVDCLLDNAGFELLGDLCLTDYLLSTAHVQPVRFHAKVHPTFVSDAIIADVHTTIAWLRYHTDSALRTLGARLYAYVQHRRLHVYTHPFWTSPLPMWEMPDDVRALLAEADVVLAKGDANYRRALGDAHWPLTTPLADIVSYFPAPLVFLRTCKAEVMAGLSSAQVHELHLRDPAWLTNGAWGVIQFVPGHA
jgi:Damage-control phosphatase ARMT1-like domain